MMTGTTRLTAGVSLAVLTLAMASAAHAQETTSAVHGSVTVAGKPVAGASVVLVHTPSGTRATTATEAGGGFDARGLRIGGPYTVTATGKGLPPKVLNNIFLEVGKTTDISIDLTGANEVEEFVVTAAGAKDSDQGPKTVLNRLAIQEVVSVTRDPRDLARRDMLVAQDLSSGRVGVNSGGVSIAGSNPRFNRIAVDGVSAQDQFGLNQGGLTTGRGPVTLDAIEQFAVAAVPTDVENGDFVGGALNLALRSGGNTFHGVLFDNFLNDGLVGKKTESIKIRQAIHQQNYGGFLSGPIWKDHLFFAVSYENYQTVETTPFGVQGAGAPNSFVNNGTQATLDNVVNTYNTRYASKFNVLGISPTQPVLDKKYSAKIDWNIMDGQRASLTYRYAESSNTLRPALNATTIQLDSQNYTKFDSDEATTFELHSTWTDRFSTFFKATTRSFIDMQTPPSGQNYADVRVCTAPTSDAVPQTCQNGFDQVFFGPDQFRHANSLAEKELRFQFTGDYSLGDHQLKFGGQARRAQPLDLFVNQSHGIYYFDSLADFTAGRANELQYQNAVSGNPLDAQFSTTYWTYSLFGQDTWQLRDDLKVAAGLRVDRYDEPDKPLLNPNFLARNGFTNQKTIDGQQVVMPRFSAEWKATPDLKISGGIGLFSGGTPDVLTGAPFYNTGYRTTSIDIRRTATGFIDAAGTPGFTPLIGSAALDNLNLDPTFGYTVPSLVQSLQRGTLTGTPSIPPLGAVIALSPSFKLPAEWKLFLSGQWDVWDGWHLSADLVATETKTGLTYFDARAQPLIVGGVQQFLPDGRIRYDGLGAVPGKTSVNGAGNNDLIVGNTSKGHSYTAAVTASKSWDWGGSVSVGYARQELRDLSSGLFFGTTAGSFYGSVPAGQDPNHDYLGRSVYEIPNRFKFEFGYHHNFFGDNETRVALFAERQDGRPFGFTMNDATSGRSPVFGVTKTAQALYVPDLNAPSATNPLRFGLVTFASQPDLDNFKRYAANFHLPSGGLVDKYSNDNAPISRVDLSFSQQIPTFIPGHKIRIQADIRNVLNLLSHNWGRVAEYSDTVRLASANCADATGAAVPTTSATCVGYRYSNVPSTVTKTINSGLSLWYAQISLRYEF